MRNRLAIPLLVAIVAIAGAAAFLADDESPEERVSSPHPAIPESAEAPTPAPTPSEPPPAPAPPPATVVQGRAIRLPEGTPVAGVAVELRRSPSWLSPLVAAAVTAEDGTFRFAGVLPPRSAGAVHARRNGLLPWCSGRLAPGAAELDLGDIALIPAAPLPGRVLRADGTPLAGARVIAIADPDALASLGEFADPYRHGIPYLTDGEGRFVAETIGAAVRLVVETGSGPPFEAGEIALPPADEVTILLPPERVWEFVVRSGSGSPVPGAEVRAAGSGLGASGPDGRIRFADDRPELPDLRILHLEHETLELGALAHATVPIEVELEPARWLLLDPAGEDGAPLGITIGSILVDGIEAPLIPAGNGFRSAPLPPASREGVLIVPGFAPVALGWPSGSGAHDVGTVPLELGTRLLVAVTDPGGSPVSDAVVQLHSSRQGTSDRPRLPGSVRTDGAGLARFGGLPNGELQIAVDHADFIRWTGRVELAEAMESRLDARLVPGAMITGRVIASDGSAIPFASVRARAGVTGMAEPHVETDGNGSFSLGRIPPGAPVILEVGSRRHPPGELSLDSLRPGEVRTLDEPIVLELGAALRGTVRDLAGDPVPRASVTLSPTESIGAGSARSGRGVQSDERGRYLIAGLLGGRYQLQVRARGFIPVEDGGEIELLGGEEVERDLVLDPGESFRGLLLSHREPIPGIEVRLTTGRRHDATRISLAPVRSDDAGEFEILGIPPGPIELTVQLDREMLSFPAEGVSALPRTIELPPGSRLHIVPIAADGGPPPRNVTLHFGEPVKPVDPDLRPRPLSIEGQVTNRRSQGMHSVQLVDGVADFGFRSEGRLEFDVTADGFEASPPIVVELGRRAIERVEVRLVRARE